MPRKSAYDTKIKPNLDKIVAMMEGGATQQQVADTLEITRQTLWRAKKQHDDVAEALDTVLELQTDNVEGFLYKSAKGFFVTETKEEWSAEKGHTKVEKKKYVKPSVTAQIFWLKNRRPEIWADRQQIAVKGLEKFFEDDFEVDDDE